LGETEVIEECDSEEEEDEVYEDLNGVEFRWQRDSDGIVHLLEVVDNERNRLAAIRIQAVVRGYLVRQQRAITA
jgi:hypothetical protein